MGITSKNLSVYEKISEEIDSSSFIRSTYFLTGFIETFYNIWIFISLISHMKIKKPIRKSSKTLTKTNPDDDSPSTKQFATDSQTLFKKREHTQHSERTRITGWQFRFAAWKDKIPQSHITRRRTDSNRKSKETRWRNPIYQQRIIHSIKQQIGNYVKW